MAEPDPVRSYGMGAGVNVNLETDKAQASVSALNAAIKSLETTLANFGNSSYNLADKINRNLKSIGETATKVTGQLGGLSAAVGASSGAKGGSAAAGATAVAAGASNGASGTGPSASQNWVQSASAAISSVVDAKRLPGGLSLGQFIGSSGDELTKDLALAPLRYLRSRINTNRDTSLMASGALSMASVQQGTTPGDMMSTLSKFPGSIYGTPQDLLGLFSNAPALGASYGFGHQNGGQGVRAAGFLRGIREMQQLNPMASVGEMTGALGGYASNTGAQQKAMMFTGGAMGMIATGGRQKSLSEWAESILKWFEGLRPGKDRGKPFDYGTLMAQYFPGSNFDAWFNVNQVPQSMRDYFWTYALGKASRSPTGTTGGPAMDLLPDKNNVAFQRLRSSSELTRTEFSLAGAMNNNYAQRESSNRWFNELMGGLQRMMIPAIGNSPLGRLISMLPDSLEDLLMTGVERGGSALLAGKGDVGDIGDSYGETGGTGLSGLHPDMKSKIGRMMQANPRLRMNSGLRDTGLQARLKSKGYANVSGKPSAHTRGMAADLGPASQYGWIMKNAKRFGLASGKGHGEPWHVGMPGDISGVGDIGDPFDDFFDAFKDFASGPEGLAKMVSKMINLMTGTLGKFLGGSSLAPDTSSPDDFYAQLVAATNTTVGVNAKNGSIDATASPNLGAGAAPAGGSGSLVGTPNGWAPNGRQWRGTQPSGRGDKYNQVASADIMRDIQSSDQVTRGAAVAKALHNAGFTGDVLRNFMRISYRESHWSNVWSSGSKDESGGILQANQLPWTKDGNPAPFTMADAMDPQAAAYIAMDQYRNVAPLNGPGGPNTYHPWNINGDWQNSIPADAAGLTDKVLKQTGLGDIEAMRANLSLVGARAGGGGITFNNEFKLAIPSYGGGSNGGIDVRRTVTLIADHLEDEMNRRLKRSA